MKISVAGGVVTGKRHALNGEECQDFYLSVVDSSANRALIVVADGAGSKKYAKESAECVAECMYELFASGLLTISSTREFLLEAINQKFSDMMLPADETGTTLLFIYICGNEFLTGHIGDGVIISDINDKFRVFSEPENGEMCFITFFVPTPDNNDTHFRLQRGTLNPDTSFVLATDGAADLLYNSESCIVATACDIIREWNIEMSSEACSKEIESSLKNLFSEYSDDDQTVAIISISADEF